MCGIREVSLNSMVDPVGSQRGERYWNQMLPQWAMLSMALFRLGKALELLSLVQETVRFRQAQSPPWFSL